MSKRYWYYSYVCQSCKVAVIGTELPVPHLCLLCSTLLYPKPEFKKSETPIIPRAELRGEVISVKTKRKAKE